jgi:hypothetical protein
MAKSFFIVCFSAYKKLFIAENTKKLKKKTTNLRKVVYLTLKNIATMTCVN